MTAAVLAEPQSGFRALQLNPNYAHAYCNRGLTYHALGTPVWLASSSPSPKPGEPDRKLRRLLVAQDTGGAIRGPIRGDVFWGFGPDVEAIAGRMKNRGKMWVLLPKDRTQNP